MTDIEKLLEETERLLAATTFLLDPNSLSIEYVPEGENQSIRMDGYEVALVDEQNDAKLFVHAPEALRELCKEVRRLQRYAKLANCAIDEADTCPECKSNNVMSVCRDCGEDWGY